MAKKPLSYFRLDSARFYVEVTDRSGEDLIAWVRSFGRALALQKPELNEYAAELLAEAIEFRKKEAERKRGNPTESGGIPRKAWEFRGFPPAFRHSFRHADKRERSRIACGAPSSREW